MFRISHERIHERMCQLIAPDERFCLICLEEMNESPDIHEMLLDGDCICTNCRKSMHFVGRTYRIGAITVHVLYEQNDFLEQVYDRLDRLRDTELAAVFFRGRPALLWRLRRRGLCALVENPDWQPLGMVCEAASIPFTQPWVRKEDGTIGLNPLGFVPRRPLILAVRADQVGELSAAAPASGALEVLALMASRDWQRRHRKDRRLHPFFR